MFRSLVGLAVLFLVIALIAGFSLPYWANQTRRQFKEY
jgi:uncharacterized protein YneF (UPF0154 family)